MSVRLKDIAESAGVSLMTVSLALNQSESLRAETRQRIQRIAVEMGYRPNAAARSMRRQRSMHVGVVTLDDAEHDYRHTALYEFQRGINEGLDQAGYLMSVVRLRDLEKDSKDRPLAVRENVLDGVIAVNALPAQDIARMASLASHVIWLDTSVAEPEGCITRDEYAAGRLAALKAIEAGYRRITWVYPFSTIPEADMTHSGDERRNGAESACREYGLSMAMCLTQKDAPPMPLERYKGSALVCADIYTARHVVARAAVSPLRVGVDFGLVCADDAFDTDWWYEDLARIRFDRVAMGREAARMMVRRIEDPKAPCLSITVGVEYTPGSSLAPKPTGRQSAASKPSARSRALEHQHAAKGAACEKLTA